MPTVAVGLILGYTCNSKCRHCLWGEALQDKSQMSLSDAYHYLDGIHELETVQEVTFSGGEPFLFLDVMTEAMAYADCRYHLSSAVTTNSYWATSYEKARNVLGELGARGLRRLQTSMDDFHREYVPLERVVNVVHAALDHKIKVTVNTVVTAKSNRRDYYVKALQIDGTKDVDVIEVQATPVGYGSSRIDRSDYAVGGEIPADICSALKSISILPDGSVQVCCGPALPCKELNAGNARRERLADIVARAEWNPIFNALCFARGPTMLVRELERWGRQSELRSGYASSCDACRHILSDLRLSPWLESVLENRREELYFLRLLADESATRANGTGKH
jgi:molybdenum cofactor biosynthesis enzyme MoaA